jgi:hypothetical protein
VVYPRGNRRVTLVLENADLMHAATTPRIRLSYRPVALAKLDQRTKEARLMRETRAALVAHVGGKPSAVQAAMIERACQLTLRIVAMDRKFAEDRCADRSRQPHVSRVVEHSDPHAPPARPEGCCREAARLAGLPRRSCEGRSWRGG